MDLTLQTPVQYVPRVGPVMAERLEKLNIFTVEDLLYHIPFRYDDYSLVSPIARVQPGETVTLAGTITAFHNAITKSGKKLQEAKVTDETASLDVIWFNQPFLSRVIPVGTLVRLAGKIDWFGHKLVMSSPSYEVVESQPQGPALSVSLHTGRLVPVYPETERVSSKWLRGRIDFVLNHVSRLIIDPVPEIIRSSYNFLPLEAALKSIHFPKSLDEAASARERLAFDEIFYLQCSSYLKRQAWEKTQSSYALNIQHSDIDSFFSSLPFTLTPDQKNAAEEIMNDLKRTIPMNRLLEGDVGSGKTVVAAIAMYAAYRNGFQSILMAPTQILAEQHYTTIKDFLESQGVSVTLVTSSSPLNSKFLIPNSGVLVGTHSLLSKKLKFKRLALVVIDEQQRFGVDQRSLLMQKNSSGKTPHILSMTATPIPRTIAKTMLGNVDLSVLNSLPSGRIKVKTWVVPLEKRERAYHWISQVMTKTQGQVFVICPLIEESETLTAVKAVRSEFEKLKSIFPHFTLGLLHGRLKPKEKSATLEAFRNGQIQMLISTPVVEVGIDVPNASIMLIEAAERFGLGQLHQLRGRVGRGSLTSYCLLFTESDNPSTLERLKSLERLYSGPQLAEVDLKLRGPGEFFGTRQHGLPPLAIASFSDQALIERAQKAVRTLTSVDTTLESFPLLREKLKKSIITGIKQD